MKSPAVNIAPRKIIQKDAVKKSSTNYFWPSYTDLMTSLFFIMLVLFVISFARIQVTLNKAKTIEEIEESFKILDTPSLEYVPDHKLFMLRRQVKFQIGQAVIPQEDYTFLEQTGKDLKSILDKSRANTSVNLKFLIIIEGTASRTPNSRIMNDRLSYERALAIRNYWDSINIRFEKEQAQLMIAGSGFEGTLRDSIHEAANQRILIQIIPKFTSQK